VPGEAGRVGGGDHQPQPLVGPEAAEGGIGRPPGLGVAVTEAADHPPPPAGLLAAVPAKLLGRLDWRVGLVGRRPGALAGLEGQHERDLGRHQGVGEAGVVAIKAVGHHRLEPDAGLLAAWTSSTASCGLVRNPGSRSPPGSRDAGVYGTACTGQ